MAKLEKLLLSPPPKRTSFGREKRRFYREGIGFGSVAIFASGGDRAVAQVNFDDVDLDWTNVTADVSSWDFDETAAKILTGSAINLAIAASRSKLEDAFTGVVSDKELAQMLDEPAFRMTDPL